MGSPGNQAKTDKKASKAKLKAEKKAAKIASEAPASPGRSDSAPSPAERSAVAAERQVTLQRFRILFALLMFLVAVVTLLWTVKPWRYLPGSNQPVTAPESGATDTP